MEWEAWAEDRTLEDYRGSFSHFSLVSSRENTTFPLFSERLMS